MPLFVIVLILLLSSYCDTTLYYPTNSAIGLFAAIAVPLDLPNRNVFVSYNFEANYNMLAKPALPYVLQDLAAARKTNDDVEVCTNCTSTASEQETIETTTTTTSEQKSSTVKSTDEAAETEIHKRSQRSLLTRTHFYHILRHRFESFGFSGEACLLRLICEVNASELGDINGVLGNLVHIIFAPSSSAEESLPLSYYQAEIDGVYEQCQHYESNCPKSILDFISSPIEHFIEQMAKK